MIDLVTVLSLSPTASIKEATCFLTPHVSPGQIQGQDTRGREIIEQTVLKQGMTQGDDRKKENKV